MTSSTASLSSRPSFRGGVFLIRARIRPMMSLGSHAVADDTAERLPDLFQIWRLSV